MIKLLQVCNVGQIVGGTAACAWTVTRSLPQFDHSVVFLSRIADETRTAFAHCRIDQWDRVTPTQIAAEQPDVILLHNTSRSRVDGDFPAVTIQYLHSKITPAAADLTIYCSSWLAAQYRADSQLVCPQAVPRPPQPVGWRESRSLREFPVVGRICTPQAKKWPPETLPLYAQLARRFPQIRWEFVGCPDALRSPLLDACGGRAEFFPASWQARSRLWHWDSLLYHNPHVTESFGRTVAEAMRAGCIPIVDNRGGFAEQLDTRCGFLCDNAEHFESALADILSPARRRTRRAHADTKFSLHRFSADLIRCFRTACH